MKTVGGVTTAEVIYDYTPSNNLDDGEIDITRQPYNHPECYHSFEITTEHLLGIDDAATLYLHHYQKKKMNVMVYHFPLKWTPSVD